MLADKKNEGPGQKERTFHVTIASPNTPPPKKKKKKMEGDNWIAVSR